MPIISAGRAGSSRGRSVSLLRCAIADEYYVLFFADALKRGVCPKIFVGGQLS